MEVLTEPGLALIRDIGLMKLDALVGRGSRKDFYDLYQIAQSIPLGALVGAAESPRGCAILG